MDITVSLQIKIPFDGNIGNVATAVKGLGLEQKVTEAVIQKADEELIEKYCAGKYARGNDKNRYQRAGSVERHPVTSVGKLNFIERLMGEISKRTKHKWMRWTIKVWRQFSTSFCWR